MFRYPEEDSKNNRRARKAPAGSHPGKLAVEELEARSLLSAATAGQLVWQPAGLSTQSALNGFPNGLSPAQVRHAYGFDQARLLNGSLADGSGQTIAIVDAYDDPLIASDLAVFDAQFGLPAPPSFRKVDENGGSAPPPTDAGWSLEIALDVEWAHAIAPRANILLVEADSDQISDLLAGVDYARHQPGVVAVSMSWGGSEFSGEASFDSYFTTPAGHIGGSGLPGGVTFVGASGDSGAPASWPTVSPNVLAVGGTTLNVDGSGNYLGETGWSGSGGGVSSFEAKPGYQGGVSQLLGTGQRGNPDVAYNADPSNGFAVYDTVAGSFGQNGWSVVGGTSAGAPQWSALVALADQGRAAAGLGSLDGAQASLPMFYCLRANSFHDVTSGNNGLSAQPGYDLVTGRGSPSTTLIGYLGDMPISPNQRFVAQIYQQLLQRSVDPTGLVAWGTQLDLGTSREQVVLAIEGSTEYRMKEVGNVYRQLLGRAADSASLNAFVGFLQSGGTIEQVEAAIAGSVEYLQNRAGGTNDGFLDAVYQDALGRVVDPIGRAAFNQLLAAGMSRTQIADIIYGSAEYEHDLAQGFYQRFLGRGGDTAGLSFFKSALAGGATDEQVAAKVVGSDEFFSRV